MKKLMIAAAIVCAAVMANAATCNWSGQGVAASTSKGAATAVTSYAIYLFNNAITSQSDMAAALAKGDTSLIEGAKVKETTGLAQGTSARWSSTGWGSYTAGESYTYYTVIFNNSLTDADQFMITPTVTATVPASGSLNMAFGSQASNSWQGMEDVPEPTSALLMLLGVAGLALKRKQK